MTESVASFLRHAAFAACLALASPAAAQPSLAPITEAPPEAQFMSRYDFHLTADSLATTDQRFTWDVRFGGDFDLVDYVKGRAMFVADYEAVLGSEYRPFDPNQGNYALEAAASGRAAGTEILIVLHHISRHFSDRPKRFAIAWNVMQARVLKRATIRGTTFDFRGDLGKVIAHAFVDYGWTADGDLLVRRPLNSKVGLYAHGYVETFGIDKTVSGRPRQTGGRLESGIRLSGPGGAAELFVGYEQVVDADPIEQLPLSWTFAGFRLVSK
jgi:hypothetical protein